MLENTAKKIKVVLMCVLFLLMISVIISSHDTIVSNILISEPEFPYDKLDLYAQEFSSKAPILVLQTNVSELDNKDGPPKLVIWVFDNGTDNRLTNVPNEVLSVATANYRGGSSMRFPKKPYKLKLYNSFFEPLEYSVLGFDPASEWVLHSPYADKSLLRNWFAYEIAATVLDLQPRGKPVQLFMQDGEAGTIVYEGVYLLCEYITEGNTRLDIGDFSLSKSESVDYKGGGYLFQLAWPTNNHLMTLQSEIWQYPTHIRLMHPNLNNMTSRQRTNLKNEISFYYNLLNKTGEYTGITEDDWDYYNYIDVNSFIDYFLVVELTKNIDAGRLSTYMHRPVGEKLIMGPLWDSDLSMGNSYYYDVAPDSFLKLVRDTTLQWDVIDSLIENEAFSASFAERWQQYRSTIWTDEKIFGLFDEMTEYLAEPAAQNAERWPELYDGHTYIWPNPEPYTSSWEEEITQTRLWLKNRVAWLDENIPQLIYKSAEEINNNGR